MNEQQPLRPGETPWDPVNGIRIGAVAGAILGGFAHLVFGVTLLAIVALAVVGGVVGYLVERRPRRR